jgi:hypothetical protein
MHDTYPSMEKDKLSMILPELSPELAATYETKNLETKYELGCGDDRSKTRESQEVLVEQGAEDTESYLRYFGALAGVTRVVLLALLAEGREDIIASRFNGSFVDAMVTVKADVEAANNVTLALHSAEGNEGNPARFNPTLENGVGCAYGANAATIGEICADDGATAALTQKEGEPMHDTGDIIERVRTANSRLNAMFFSNPETAGLSRSDFAATMTPVQVLGGAHAQPQDTLAVLNFTPDKVSNPKAAAERGKPFYNNDVTQVAELLIRAYPNLQLDPETLFAVMDQDIRATRAALAGGDASAIKQERLGDPESAIKYLQQVQKQADSARA